MIPFHLARKMLDHNVEKSLDQRIIVGNGGVES